MIDMKDRAKEFAREHGVLNPDDSELMILTEFASREVKLDREIRLSDSVASEVIAEERAEKAEGAVRPILNALEESKNALFGAWQMLSAICETDSSVDRLSARDRAKTAYLAACSALAQSRLTEDSPFNHMDGNGRPLLP